MSQTRDHPPWETATTQGWRDQGRRWGGQNPGSWATWCQLEPCWVEHRGKAAAASDPTWGRLERGRNSPASLFTPPSSRSPSALTGQHPTGSRLAGEPGQCSPQASAPCNTDREVFENGSPGLACDYLCLNASGAGELTL